MYTPDRFKFNDTPDPGKGKVNYPTSASKTTTPGKEITSPSEIPKVVIIDRGSHGIFVLSNCHMHVLLLDQISEPLINDTLINEEDTNAIPVMVNHEYFYQSFSKTGPVLKHKGLDAEQIYDQVYRQKLNNELKINEQKLVAVEKQIQMLKNKRSELASELTKQRQDFKDLKTILTKELEEK